MTDPEGLTYGQIYSELRAVYLGKRHWIEICAEGKGYAARDEAWHTRQRAQLRAVEQAGQLMAVIAANADSFDAWLASVKPKEAA